VRVVAGRADVADVDDFVAWLQAVGEDHACAVQAFDARYVADRAHLAAAVEHATRAMERGENVARERAVEILLYAAGRRQIDQAVEMGVPAGEAVPLVVAVDADVRTDREAGETDGESTASAAEAAVVEVLTDRIVETDAVLGGSRDDERLREFFEITDREMTAAATDLEGLVRERVALLDVEK
jgi:KEOPS complex subunit Cgi121